MKRVVVTYFINNAFIFFGFIRGRQEQTARRRIMGESSLKLMLRALLQPPSNPSVPWQKR